MSRPELGYCCSKLHRGLPTVLQRSEDDSSVQGSMRSGKQVRYLTDIPGLRLQDRAFSPGARDPRFERGCAGGMRILREFRDRCPWDLRSDQLNLQASQALREVDLLVSSAPRHSKRSCLSKARYVYYEVEGKWDSAYSWHCLCKWQEAAHSKA